ncbi:type III secretion system inner rod subunit SctI [Vibrio sp. TBV020]|uniref:type III secretion system inner rod subunit SctI n=1 Tax=Vibrio sp. TBV020 TaxID=3137398 RepID=UPI0038CDBA35
MINETSFIEKSYSLPSQPVSNISLAALFEQHLQASTQPMGEAILEQVQNIRGNINHQSADIQNRMDLASEMTLPELMKIQTDLSRLVLMEEILAKTVSKSTQSLDTLLKSQ